eukprot:GHRQ01022766.1.p1 GENE.GHRQ01022766.1~~GHRQ01022766.1.p1  ORF type:complete len:203 (-),score=33.84 GHRQ01022766.1:738-1346(-)
MQHYGFNCCNYTTFDQHRHVIHNRTTVFCMLVPLSYHRVYPAAIMQMSTNKMHCAVQHPGLLLVPQVFKQPSNAALLFSLQLRVMLIIVPIFRMPRHEQHHLSHQQHLPAMQINSAQPEAAVAPSSAVPTPAGSSTSSTTCTTLIPALISGTTTVASLPAPLNITMPSCMTTVRGAAPSNAVLNCCPSCRLELMTAALGMTW